MSGAVYVRNESKTLRTATCEEALIEIVDANLKFAKTIGLQPPVLLFAALTGCEGARIKTAPQWCDFTEHAFEDSVIYMPDEKID